MSTDRTALERLFRYALLSSGVEGCFVIRLVRAGLAAPRELDRHLSQVGERILVRCLDGTIGCITCQLCTKKS